MTTANSFVGLTVSPSQQGIAYGLAQSANSLGHGIGPLLGGSLGRLMGLRSVFGVTAGLFTLIGLVVAKLLAKVQLSRSDSRVE